MKVESNVTTIAGAVLSGLASASCRSAWFGARTLLSEFPPLVTLQTVETTRQRTLCVGARLEQQAVAGAGSKSVEAAKTIALSIDGGHVRAAREYQGRSFEALLAQVGSDEGKQVVSIGWEKPPEGDGKLIEAKPASED